MSGPARGGDEWRGRDEQRGWEDRRGRDERRDEGSGRHDWDSGAWGDPDRWGDPDPEEIHEAEESMAGFRRKPSGEVSARFSAAQAGIIRNLVSQVAELIGDPPLGGDPLASWPGEDPAAGRSGGAGGGPGSAEPFDLEDLAAILGGDGPTEPPEDPVLARLFPDAYRDDPESAGEFRRFTEQGLRSAKAAAARRVLATLPGDGGRVRLSEDDAQAWLRSLNDVRLALGVRLGVTDDYEEEASRIGRDDPRSAYVYVYDWLTFLQDTLVRALW